jgi:hypothetical protein
MNFRLSLSQTLLCAVIEKLFAHFIMIILTVILMMNGKALKQ